MNYTLNIASHSWNKDSNLLFDYETNDYYLHNQTVCNAGILTKNGKRFDFLQKPKQIQENYLGTISHKGDNYFLEYEDKLKSGCNNSITSLDEKMWIVIRNTHFLENEGYRLRNGDLMKLGKVIFKVKEIKVESANQKKNNNKSHQNNNSISHFNVENKSGLLKEKTLIEMKNNYNSSKGIDFQQIDKTKNKDNLDIVENKEKKKKYALPSCRVCLMDDNDPSNPLVNPCNCIGSVRFIHVDCIKKWLMSKITTKMFNFLIVHSFKNLECELCKKTLPEKIKFKNDIINIYEMQKPDNNYIMLESISREKRENRYLYIIHLKDKKSIKLGRANDSDVRMTDISVSRNHATLKIYNGNLYLQDNSSKFGTLIGLNTNILMSPQRQLAIQCGRLYFLFNMKKTCLATFRCYKNKYLSNLDYNDYLEEEYYKSKGNENFFDYISCRSISENELESIQSSIKLPRKSEEEIKEESLLHKEYDEAAGIELKEINRDNLFSSGKNNQFELLRNQNQTDISLNRNNINLSENPLRNLNEEKKEQTNSQNNLKNNNNNILTTSFFNINTSQANIKCAIGRISTENELNIINEEIKRDQSLNNSNNIKIQEKSISSNDDNSLEDSNKSKVNKEVNEQSPELKKIIPLLSHSETEKVKSRPNIDIYDKITIKSSNSIKYENDQNKSKSIVYSNLGSNEDISLIPISCSGKLNFTENLNKNDINFEYLNKEKEIDFENENDDFNNQKRVNTDIFNENEKSNNFHSSKISSNCLLNNSNILLDEKIYTNFKNENLNMEKYFTHSDQNPNQINNENLESNNSKIRFPNDLSFENSEINSGKREKSDMILNENNDLKDKELNRLKGSEDSLNENNSSRIDKSNENKQISEIKDNNDIINISSKEIENNKEDKNDNELNLIKVEDEKDRENENIKESIRETSYENENNIAIIQDTNNELDDSNNDDKEIRKQLDLEFEKIDELNNLYSRSKTYNSVISHKKSSKNIFNLETLNNEEIENSINLNNNNRTSLEFIENVDVSSKLNQEKFNIRNSQFSKSNQLGDLDLIHLEDSHGKIEQNFDGEIPINTKLIEENKIEINQNRIDEICTLTEADNIILTNIIDIDIEKETEKETETENENNNIKEDENDNYNKYINDNDNYDNKNLNQKIEEAKIKVENDDQTKLIEILNKSNEKEKEKKDLKDEAIDINDNKSLKKNPTVEDIFEDLFIEDKKTLNYQTCLENNNKFLIEKINLENNYSILDKKPKNKNEEKLIEKDSIKEKEISYSKSERKKPVEICFEKNEEILRKHSNREIYELDAQSICKNLINEDPKGKNILNDKENFEIESLNKEIEDKNQSSLVGDDFL